MKAILDFFNTQKIQNLENELRRVKQELDSSKSQYVQIRFDYHKSVSLLETVYAEHTKLLSKWNSLVDTINRKGGQSFLDSPPIKQTPQLQLSNDDIFALIKFCHPDKHGGNPKAGELTAKLLLMRKNG